MKLLCTLNDPDLCKNKCFHFFHFESVYSSALVIFSKVIISGSNNDTLFPFNEKLEVHLLLAKFEEMATLLNYLPSRRIKLIRLCWSTHFMDILVWLLLK